MGRTGRILRRVRATVTDRPTNFSWVLEGRLAASGLPSSRAQLQWLSGKGVDSVLTLTERPLPVAWRDTLRMEFKHIPMADHAPPDFNSLAKAADYIDSRVADGRVLLVHCLAGKGRTGSAIAAYMVAHQGKSAAEAMESLRRIRPGSVELPQQAAVREFAEKFRGLKTQRQG